MAIKINKDIQISDTGVSLENLQKYSTTETKIGTWIDGKPLYRKVYQFTASFSSGNNVISCSTPNMKKCVYARLITVNDSYTFPYFTADGKYTFIQSVYGNQFTIRTNDSWGSQGWLIVMEYTKTTD